MWNEQHSYSFGLILLITALSLNSCKTRRVTSKNKAGTIQQVQTLKLPDNDNLLLGMPTTASTDTSDNEHFLIRRIYYSLSYNTKEGKPNWVCWHLTKSDLGNTGRAGKFRADSSLPSGYYRVKPGDYIKSGFDRGHNCPSGDRTSNVQANAATFLMSNMVPQAPRNNRQTWAHLEEYIRILINHGNEAYIIMGNYGSIGSGSKDTASQFAGGKIKVPSHIWKVAVILPEGNGDLNRIDTSTRIIAVDTPNQQDIQTDWKPYITTIHQIDSSGGYKLLDAVPDSIRRILDYKKDSGL